MRPDEHSTSTAKPTGGEKPTLKNATETEAASLLEHLLGSYPGQTVGPHYSVEAVKLLTEYPSWAGERAVREHVRSKKWVPAISQLRKGLDEQVRVLRDAAAWEAATKVSDAERLSAPPKPSRPTYDDLKARYGPNWGIVNPDKVAKREPTKAEALAALYAEFGRELVDAVPDAPPRERAIGEIRDDLAGKPEPAIPDQVPGSRARGDPDDPLEERWAAE